MSNNRSLVYRTHSLWSDIPLEIKEIRSVHEFMHKVIKYLWKQVAEDLDKEWDNSLSEVI